MTIWTCLPADKSKPPVPRDFGSLNAALAGVASSLQDSSKAGSKDRIDLDALKVHTGETYVQHVLIPDALHETLRTLHGVTPLVLLPSGAGGDSVAGSDAIVLLRDTHASTKGLPANMRATMVLNACGLKQEKELRGDCFIGRLSVDTDGALALGAECAPPMLAQRDWLERAQAAHKASGGAPPELEQALATLLAESRKRAVRATLNAQAADAAGAGPAAAKVAMAAATAAAKAEAATAAKTEAAKAKAEAAGLPTNAYLDASDGMGGDVAPCESSREEARTAAASSGAVGELAWEDGHDDVTVRVRVPEGTKSKHIKCKITASEIHAEVMTLQGDAYAADAVVMHGPLFQEVSAEDSMWHLEDEAGATTRTLVVSLQKKERMRWLVLTRSA